MFASASLELTETTPTRPSGDEIDNPPAATSDISTAAVVEMLLKDHARLNRLLRDEGQQRELSPRLLAVAVVGFAAYGVVLTGILNALRSQTGFWFPHLPSAFWSGPSIANLALAYTLGPIAANGICLPSFYFYGLLAGIKTTMLGVAAHAIKGMASGAVALVGFLPVYVAVALTSVVFPAGVHWQLPTVAVGLALPFLAGVVGAANLYEGFVALGDTMTGPHCGSRRCFLRRLILAWCGCASFVTPVVIYTLWHFLSTLAAPASFGG